MMPVYLQQPLRFIGWILLQVLIFNQIHVLGYATPFLYIYFILKLSSDGSKNQQMLIAFFLGLLIDIFSDTPGMNAAAATALAFVRIHLLRLFTPRDLLDNMIPSVSTMGMGAFTKYIVSCTLIHHFVLISIELFSVVGLGYSLLRILASSTLTILLILLIEAIKKK